MRSAVAGLQVVALAFAAAAVGLDLLGQHLRHPVLVVQERRAAPAPPEDLQEYRLGQAEDRIQDLTNEHRLLTYLLVGNLVAVVVSMVTYLLVGRRRSGRS